MELAAIATAAVPGLTPVGFAALSDDAEDFDSALVVDALEARAHAAGEPFFAPDNAAVAELTAGLGLRSG